MQKPETTKDVKPGQVVAKGQPQRPHKPERPRPPDKPPDPHPPPEADVSFRTVDMTVEDGVLVVSSPSESSHHIVGGDLPTNSNLASASIEASPPSAVRTCVRCGCVDGLPLHVPSGNGRTILVEPCFDGCVFAG